MARYRSYPKYQKKITIRKAWADKLKKLNYQQLTLKLNEIDKVRDDLANFRHLIEEKYNSIKDLRTKVEVIRRKLLEEIAASNSTLFNFLFNEAHPNQSREINENISKNFTVKKLIQKAECLDNEAMKIMEDRDSFIKKHFSSIYSDANIDLAEHSTGIQFKTNVYSYRSKSHTPLSNGRQSKYEFTIADEYHTINIPPGGYLDLDNLYKSLIEIRKLANRKEKSAKLASYEGKSRSVGKSLMSSMKEKVKSPYYCPYCDEQTSKNNLHVDHINPVSNGGLSVERNLIAVCSECNLSKSDLSLRAFCKKDDLDLESICDRLEKEGKFI